MGDNPVLKKVKPYFTYAEAMRQGVPIMAYHCKFYGVQTGLKACNANPGDDANTAKAYLIQQLSELESMKQAMGDVKQEDLKYHVENWVLSKFAQIDKEERTAEEITKKHAMEFKRTADFIAILELFEETFTEEW